MKCVDALLREDPSFVQSGAQASNPISQPLVEHLSVIKPVTNASPFVPVSISPPELANSTAHSGSGLPVAAPGSESSGLVTNSLQMPLQSTWCVRNPLIKLIHDVLITASGHNEPISERETWTPKQRPAALHPTKTPAQRSNVSHKSTLPPVDHSDGLDLPADASMQSEVSEPNQTVRLRNVTSQSPT